MAKSAMLKGIEENLAKARRLYVLLNEQLTEPTKPGLTIYIAQLEEIQKTLTNQLDELQKHMDGWAQSKMKSMVKNVLKNKETLNQKREEARKAAKDARATVYACGPVVTQARRLLNSM